MSSYSTAEQLEDRTLLAGASLVNIEPNIDLSLTDGEVYNEAPQELTFVFSPGQEIDPDYLGGIQIVRSGQDGTFADGNEVPIEPGYIGIGDNPNEVIVRFASALPDDHYQITILGTGVDRLRNLNGDAFQDFTDDGIQNGADQTINFELDLGAKVVAVVSQPVLREQILSVGDVANLQDGDTFTITVGGASVTFEMDLDGGLNDPNNIQVSYDPDTQSASDIATTILREFNSSILGTEGYATISQSGADLTISGDSFTPAISFALVNPDTPGFSRTDGNLVARDNQILVYFNDDDLNPDLANDSRFYRIIDTANNDSPLLTTNYTAKYDALSDVTVLKLSTSLNAGTQYRLRVGVSDTPDEITEETYSTLGLDSETISVLAGEGGSTTTPTDGMLITDLILNDPSSLVVDGAGNYYFVHNDGAAPTPVVRILRVDHQTGLISIVAGSDGSAAPANDILAGDLQLSATGPRDLTLDANGNLYFTDGAFVLKVNTVSQLVTVIAGGGFDHTPNTGDVPTDLVLDSPAQLTVDLDGNIYVHDSGSPTSASYLFRIDNASGLVLGAIPTFVDAGILGIIHLGITDLETDATGDLFFATTSTLPLSSYSSYPDIYPGIIQLVYNSDGTPGFELITGNGSSNGSLSSIQTGDPIAGDPGDPISGDPPTSAATLVDASNITDFTFDADGYLVYADSTGHIVRFNPYADPAERFVEVIAGGGSTSPASGVVATEAALSGLSGLTTLAMGTGNTPYFFDSTSQLLLSVENIPDQNSSFDNATDLTDIAHHWNAGTEEFVITSEIQPQGIGLPPPPGGKYEPGHRHLPAMLDAHIDNSGTNPVTAGSVSVAYYNFQDEYGIDVQGNVLHNAITEEQKQRAREIFEIYAYYLGIEFIESADQGLTVVTGDLRALDPSKPVGPDGVLGLAPHGGYRNGTLVIDATDVTTPEDDVFGGTWMDTAFHEIGHTLGLGHAYDLSAIMGGDSETTGSDLPQDPGQTVYPGDYDIDHLLRLFRHDANDIDLYKFNLAESGTFRAEVFAERLEDTSLLNSILTLFDEDHNVIARNDDYFSNDSFLELNLAAGTYFIGVTSTGNDNYNPEIENSGDNGTTDGKYELRLNFASNPNSVAVTTDNGFITDEETLISNNVFSDNGSGADSDPDASDVLSVSAVNGNVADVNNTITLASGAQLTLNADGTFDYDPNGAFDYLADSESATDSFTYTIDDGYGGTDTATVTINIEGLNDAPLAQNDTFQLNQTGTFTGNVIIGSDSDPDASDTIAITQLEGLPVNIGATITLASGATVILDSYRTFSYEPTGNSSYTDTFTYQISDSDGEISTATVTLVISDNDLPIATTDTAATNENTAITNINVLANDIDPDGDDSNLTVNSVTSASGATLDLNLDGTIDYDPAGIFNDLSVGETATDTFTYTLEDELGRQTVGTVVITITGVNDPVTANTDAIEADEDSPLNADLFADNGNGIDSDQDANDTLTVTRVNGFASLAGVPLVGTELTLNSGALLTVNADGTFTYDPNGMFESLAVGETDTDSFTYTISDGNGSSSTATATIIIQGANDAVQVAAAVTATATKDDATFNLDLLTDSSDIDTTDILSIDNLQLISGDDTGITVNGNSLDIDPSVYHVLTIGETETIVYSYDIIDGNGGSISQTATITIHGNVLPVATEDITATDEDNPLLNIDVLTNDIDPDGDDNNLTVVGLPSLTSLGGATLSLNIDGTINYDPTVAFNNLFEGQTVTDTFTYTLEDEDGGQSTGTVTITVTGVNDAPSAGDDAFTIDQDGSLVASDLFADNGSGTDSDPDTGDAFTITALTVDTLPENVGDQITLTSGALLTVYLDGTFDYDPNGVFDYLADTQSATDSFTYTIDDGNGGTDTATVTITINGLNDDPVAQADAFTIDQDGSLSSENVFSDNGSGSDSDPDAGVVLSVSAV
ncbi:MAG TPA: hypothetical protein DCM07_32080, partial [Planctomycetaceae bacterium]|nr:hypothetical protein [Planctomycetaceae bacterium]